MTCKTDQPLYDIYDTLGASVPANTPHAISVSLPTWVDYLGYAGAEARVIDAMTTGYPRFFIHRSVRRLAQEVQETLGHEGELCLLFQTAHMAQECHDFIKKYAAQQTGCAVAVRTVDFPIHGPFAVATDTIPNQSREGVPLAMLHAVFFPVISFPLAKKFWQHTGMGITSRFAEHCLALLFPGEEKATTMPWTPAPPFSLDTSIEPLGGIPIYNGDRELAGDMLENADAAKLAIRQRIAKLEQSYTAVDGRALSSSDVYLFPTGMQALVAAHKMAMAFRPGAKSVCFGFPYADTLKILEKFGPGCHFLSHGRTADLSKLLAAEARPNAVFTECPSNPLLATPDFRTLRALADQHDFLLVIDATIGNMCNVDVLPYADIVVHSLSKIFSGRGDVTGGSLTLNPAGAHYATLQACLDTRFEDSYFGPDAIVMEHNSRAIEAYIAAIDGNAEEVADFLRLRTVAGGAAGAAVKEVFYPKWTRRAEYDAVRRRKRPTGSHEAAAMQADSQEDGSPGAGENTAEFAGGFGGLLSLTFVSLAASRAFFDTLACYKGPSLGTRFTLACPYALIAHNGEMEWAATFGVEEGIVRISVGCEDRTLLMRSVREALAAAQEVVDNEGMKRQEQQAQEGRKEDTVEVKKTLDVPVRAQIGPTDGARKEK